MKNIQKILVPTDLSEYSLAALEYAESLASIYGAQLYLLNIVESEPTFSFHTVDHTSETILRDGEALAAAKLKQFKTEHLREGNNISCYIRRGNAYEEIISFAKKHSIDLIVMATHGRTGLAHVFIGSVAEKIIRHSPIPVLTIKPESLQHQFIAEEDSKEQLHVPA